MKEMRERRTGRQATVWLCTTAILMAMNIAVCPASVPVPGGHFYLNDIIICTAAILMDPLAAFMVGGVGAFLGDMIFYPLPMFVSLVTHGLQAVVISVFAHYVLKKKAGTCVRHWRQSRCCHYGSRLHLWKSVHLRHTCRCHR